MQRILLVRHGSTDWADRHIMQGISDIPLNEKGIRQTDAAAQALKTTRIDTIYTSPLSRCRQTAESIGKVQGTGSIDLKGLEEQHFGWLEGHPVLFFKLQNASAFEKLLLTSWYGLLQFLSGESDQGFRQRVRSAWQQILAENPQGTILIAAHVLVIRVILEESFGDSKQNDEGRYFIEPASISEIELDDDGIPKLVRLNDTAHLTGLVV